MMKKVYEEKYDYVLIGIPSIFNLLRLLLLYILL